jgi:hypothetical protein
MPGAEVHETKGLDIEEPDTLVLDSMEHDVGLEVLCRDQLVWALLS